MNKFKHSGAFGDLIYSLPLVKHFGGGDFYLHLNQIDWIGMNYYGSKPDPFHQGRLTEKDYEFMQDFMLAQEYINEFSILDSNSEVTHNLDRFRPVFVGHPGNYVDIYAAVFGFKDPEVKSTLRNTAWLTVPETKQVKGRGIVINRTLRWIPPSLGKQWYDWRHQGVEQNAFFLGLEHEYDAFKKATDWNIPYQPVSSMLELAQYIAGAERFIGNQSVALSLAIGLGAKFSCELRKDLPLERNECYFKDHPRGYYF